MEGLYTVKFPTPKEKQLDGKGAKVLSEGCFLDFDTSCSSRWRRDQFNHLSLQFVHSRRVFTEILKPALEHLTSHLNG